MGRKRKHGNKNNRVDLSYKYNLVSASVNIEEIEVRIIICCISEIVGASQS